ncbi:methylenetetrahydrofolate reductase [NAD(P)H] [Actinomycetota bacterium]
MAPAVPADHRIPSRLARPRPSISFEFMPPRSDEGEAQLWDAVRRLERVRPDFVSVTYGAGGSTQDRTVRVTERIALETTMTPIGHLTCVGASVTQLRRVIGQYAAAGVRDILALRGDPPGGNVGADWVAHPEGLNHADELVSLVRSLGDFTVGVAAFPDVHPRSKGFEEDVEVLVRKADAGAEFAITQMVFDPATYARLRDAVAGRRDLPITPGLMPITNLKQIKRMSELMGTPIPPRLVERLEAAGDDAAAVREVGIEIATELGQTLLDEGAPGIHFITMNRSTAALEVHGNLSLADAGV